MRKAVYDAHKAGLDRLKALGRAYIVFGLEYPVHHQLMFTQRSEFMNCPHPQNQSQSIDAFGVLHRTVKEALDLGVIVSEHPTRIGNRL